uniref:Zinc ABC transporter substrate-binding protein n=1 Tax=Dictyoglomus thermophilum TaxID=14 RepID=A0A7C3MJM7_DICTH
MKKIVIFIILSIITLLNSIYGIQTISVSIPPIGSILRYIAGEKWRIEVLLPQNTNPHLFEPTPNTMKAIENSKLIIINGGDVDLWAMKLINTKQKDLLIIADRIKNKDDNPHYWLDPLMVKEIAQAIYEKLRSIDPQNQAYYQNNLKIVEKNIQEIDNYIRRSLSPYKKREIIAYHPSWYYFYKRYDIKVLSYIEEGEGKEPSLKKIQEIINIIKKHKIKYIVKEPFINPPVIRTIQKETGVKVVDMDPIGFNKDYFSLIKENTNILRSIFYEQNH